MRQRARAKLSITLSLLAMLSLASPAQAFQYESGPPGVADGAGIWANMWNYPEGDLDKWCLRQRDHGITNVFIQTSRSNTAAIAEPEKLGALLEACHKQNIRVIAWSFSELVDPIADAEKMITAAQFKSPSGEQIDGIAPNMEKNLEAWRIEKYSKHIRSKLGQNYPMMAVVYSPLNRCFEVARIPWTLLAEYYDSIAPMIYWNSKYQKLDPYSYTVSTVKRIRELTERPDIEIHAIGDGMGTSSEAFKQFMRACKDTETTGISLYPNQRLTDDQMLTLKSHSQYVEPNARFRLAALRELIKAEILTPPPAKDPTRSLSRGDFYKVVVTQLYPALVSPKGSKSNWPTAADCAGASSVEAYGILAGLGHVPEPPDNEPVDAILAGFISSGEAEKLVSHVVSGDRRQAQHKGHPARMDAWLTPAAVAAPPPVTRSGSGELSYIEAAHMVVKASSRLR